MVRPGAIGFPLRNKGLMRQVALPLLLLFDFIGLTTLTLLCGGNYPDGRLSYLTRFSVLQFSVWSSFADVTIVTLTRWAMMWFSVVRLETYITRETINPLAKSSKGPLKMWSLASIGYGVFILVYAMVKLSLCLSHKGGLSEAMPYTPVGLAHTILDLFVISSFVWLLLAIWSVRYLRSCKKASLRYLGVDAYETGSVNESSPLLFGIKGRTSSVGSDGKPVTNADRKNVGIRRLMALAKPEVPILIPGLICLVIANTASLAAPAYFGKIVDSVSSAHSKEALTSSVLSLLLLFAISAAAGFANKYIFNLAGHRLVARLRKDLFSAVMRQDVSFFDQNHTGELQNRLSSDTQVIQSAITMSISMLVENIIKVIGALGIMFWYSWRLTSVMLSVVPVVAIGSVIYGRFVRQLRKKFQDKLADANKSAEEAISSIRTVRSFGNEDKAWQMYAHMVDASFRLGRRTAAATAGFTAWVSMLGQAAIVLVLWYGGTLVLDGSISAGLLSTFMLYTLSVAMAFMILSSMFGEVMQALGASERIFHILDNTPEIEPTGWSSRRPSAVRVRHLNPSGRLEGELEFRNVVFRYPSRPDVTVLDYISFEVKKSSVVALVGVSGGGKTTIVQLIERFYDPIEGNVTVDGIDITNFDPKWYRRQLALVGQEPVLFSGTIAENIAYGRPGATMDAIVECAKKANAHNFIMSFPEAYETNIGERGVRLSGGQKQRIAIARALLMDPCILLLDEATSALDAESEHLVQEAIDRIMLGRTVLIIAHRLSTVRNADVVLVIDKGRVVEKGKHEELIALNGIYSRLVQRQLQSASRPPSRNSDLHASNDVIEDNDTLHVPSITNELPIEDSYMTNGNI